MKIFIYNIRDYDERPIFDMLSEKYGFEYTGIDGYETEENARMVEGCQAVSILVSGLTDRILEIFAEHGIKYLITRSVGTDHINLEKCRELGIRVSHVDYGPEGVAEYAVMLMLMLLRRMGHIMKRVEVQDFSLKNKMGREISQCTVGVIGTGRIGKTVISDLSGFGCKLLACGHHPEEMQGQRAEAVSFDRLIEESDIITLHTPGGEDNFHLISKAAIEKMKMGVLIVNTARGTLIDTDALIEGIESGKIGGAALDVLEDENGLYYWDRSGDVIDNRQLAMLKSFPNVIVSPHTAFYTDQAVYGMCYHVFEAVRRFEAGEENPLEAKA